MTAPHLPQDQPEHQESQRSFVKPPSCTCSYPRVIARNMCGHPKSCPYYDEWLRAVEAHFDEAATPPPQPAKPKCITCGREGHGACGGLGPVPKQSNPKPLSTTPIESDPVNAWMLANGWTRQRGTEGFWYREDMPTLVHDDLAAEMYRMSEVRVAEAKKAHDIDIKINKMDAYQRGASLGGDYILRYHPELHDGIAMQKILARLEWAKGEYVKAIEEYRALTTQSKSEENE